ncbi:FAD-dependent thymidylate synthase [bacterium]|nr:FAD-dependent thymidylate synthase [bacterium]
MEVLLAGMNIDTELLKDLVNSLRQAAISISNDQTTENKQLAEEIFTMLDADNLTPETIAAAYARISRDPRPVNQLREDSRLRIGKARRSNKSIIFGLGHSSIAEHAVFNLDVIGVTRYLSEYIQSHRLCSFTEKSQRYIKQDKDYIVPSELHGSSLAEEFEQFVLRRFNDYNKLCRIMREDLDHDPDQCGEDARYVLPLAVTTQMGVTLNARNLEKLLQQAASSDLIEFRTFGEKLFSVIDGVAPSLVKYTEGSSKNRELKKNLRTRFPFDDINNDNSNTEYNSDVKLISVTPDGDTVVARAYLSSLNGRSFTDSGIIESISNKSSLKTLFLEIFKTMESWESPPREFEYAEVFYELIISAAAYAQMKRHRMATMNTGPYDPDLGVTIPPVLKNTSAEQVIMQAAKESNDLADRLREIAPEALPYVYLACHRRRLLVKMNARELIHLSRLREDIHAQWDIRNISTEMIRQARVYLPGSMIMACGKHEYSEYKKQLSL